MQDIKELKKEIASELLGKTINLHKFKEVLVEEEDKESNQ